MEYKHIYLYIDYTYSVHSTEEEEKKNINELIIRIYRFEFCAEYVCGISNEKVYNCSVYGT